MKRLLPKSLAGQMTLLLGLALLVAQLINFALILNERQKLSLAQNQGPALIRFASVASDVTQAAPEFRQPILEDNSHRGARFDNGGESGIADAERDATLETRLSAALQNQGLRVSAVRAAIGPGSGFNDLRGRRDMQTVRLAAQQPGGRWLRASIATPRADPWLSARLLAATLILYLVVLGATVWIARRLARPLRDLTSAADAFRGRAEPVPVVPSGPADLRLAIDAFNAMNRRLLGLLDEKDRMLGAIGHDLRTPLASLRIRIESMEPADEREAAIAKVGELTAMLEDILVLARSGRSREAARPVDLAALAEAVVEEYVALGQPVAWQDSPRAPLSVQPDLLRRALRNLVDNAVRYGGSAKVSVAPGEGGTDLSIEDSGPGIPPEHILSVMEPFQRGEGSRNRATGGSGLGLAIARSIAEAHGGTLRLENKRAGGLRAIMSLPAAEL